jgi:TldD protein
MTSSYTDSAALAAARAALDRCSLHGASYADARVIQLRTEHLVARETDLQSAFDHSSLGIGIRVLKNGRWGFASAPSLDAHIVKRVADQALRWTGDESGILPQSLTFPPALPVSAEWTTPHAEHPFAVAFKDKVEFIRGLGSMALSAGARYCDVSLWSIQEQKLFVSTEGSTLRQEILRVWCEAIPTVTTSDGTDFESRSTSFAPAGAGFEKIRFAPWNDELSTAVAHAKQKLASPHVTPGEYDLIIHPTNLWLTIHESCGHATECDRALGYEADYAGTSFLTPDALGKLQYGSPLVTIAGNRSEPGGLATVGFDDEGIAAQSFPIIKQGIFTNYQTNREFASRLYQTPSFGCAYADSWQHLPLQRMPNICLQPSPSPLSLKDLIGATEHGLFVYGDKSYSIDQQRRSFQFSGQEFWRIKDGKLDGMVRDAAYFGKTTQFWNSLDALCDKSEYHLGGSLYCGKGQPAQLAPVSHGAVPARFRNVSVLRSGGNS